MVPFDEAGFREFMDSTVKLWLRETVSGGQFESFDGRRIQYYRAVCPEMKGVIVIVHGFLEFFGKFHEVAYNFWENGYTVYFIEQRGHGTSYRPNDVLDRVDIADFSEYVRDLKHMMDAIVISEMKSFAEKQNHSGKLPLLMYAHSMGGCIGSLFLEQYPQYFDAAVLNAPMLKMKFGDFPAWQGKALVYTSRLIGLNDQKMPGQSDFDPKKPDYESSGTLSRARYDYQFQLRADPESNGIYSMNCGTFRWGRAAYQATKKQRRMVHRIRIPVLVCQAGMDAFVDNEGQDHFVKTAKHAKLVKFPKAKHEIYAATADILPGYYKIVNGFYERVVRRTKND